MHELVLPDTWSSDLERLPFSEAMEARPSPGNIVGRAESIIRQTRSYSLAYKID
jgi:hypothetical protein